MQRHVPFAARVYGRPPTAATTRFMRGDASHRQGAGRGGGACKAAQVTDEMVQELQATVWSALERSTKAMRHKMMDNKDRAHFEEHLKQGMGGVSSDVIKLKVALDAAIKRNQEEIHMLHASFATALNAQKAEQKTQYAELRTKLEQAATEALDQSAAVRDQVGAMRDEFNESILDWLRRRLGLAWVQRTLQRMATAWAGPRRLDGATPAPGDGHTLSPPGDAGSRASEHPDRAKSTDKPK
mmetsp:Transcript_142975/g.249494  ORF Transcript_142975/g.249494 Transcript_142975/m.249494 type:complete len:241 (-) Transcript_142975:973-1695(-)